MFVLKTGTRSWSNVGREARALDELEPSVDADRCATHVAFLARDLARQRPAREEVAPDHRRVDARAEVVDVRDGHDAHAAASRSVSSVPERRSAWKRSPCPGAYGEGSPARRRGTAHPTGSSRSETNWLKTSGSPRPRSATCARIASSVAKLVISATGTRRVERALERRGLLELRLEEALAVDGREHRLHDAAEARRHPTREHDLRDLAAPKRLDAGRASLVVPRARRDRERRQVLGARRLDRAADDVRLRRELARRRRVHAASRRAPRRTRTARGVRRSRRSTSIIEALRTGSEATTRTARDGRRTSVTIAVTSSAGVTSKAGFRAGKRDETSRRIALLDRDVGARRGRGSSVDVGATT